MSPRPSKKALYRYFQSINAQFFSGTLPPAKIHWCRMRAYGSCEERSEQHPHGRICLSTMNMPPCTWRGVLLHEAIHLSLDEGDVDEYEHGTVAFHGPVFTAEANRIGRLLGIPDIEESESWAWPYEHHYIALVPCVDE